MPSRATASVWVIAGLALVCARSASGADHAGRVTLGGTPVPGVRITASQGQQRATTSTGADGTYRLTGLADGTWTVQVEMSGFAPMTRDISLAPSAPPAAWELTILPMTEITRGLPPPPPAPPPAPAARAAARANGSSREGRGPAAPPGTTAAPAGGFQRAGVTATPPAAAPGAPAAGAAALAAAARPPLPAPAAGDAAASADSFLVNGSVNSGALPQPSLGNVRRATGIRLYSGNISIRGSNSAFDATPYSISGQPIAKPDTSTLGVSGQFGGPFRIPGLMRNTRNATVNFQHTARNDANTLSELMPTLLQRGGDFSQTVDGAGRAVMVIDPLTGQPFPGNVIPPDRISAQAASLLRYYPIPDPSGGGAYNYQIATLSRSESNSIGASSSLWSNNWNQLSVTGNYSQSSSHSTSLFGFNGANRSSGFTSSISWLFRTLPSGQIYQVRHSYSRQASKATPFFANLVNVSGEAGIAGNNQDPVNWGPPSLSFASGIAGLSDTQYSSTTNQTHTFGLQTQRSRGRHNVSYGGEGRLQLIDLVSQQNARGSFTFNGNATGYDFADFLLGLPNTSAIAFGNADKGYHAHNVSAFVTDDFRVNPGLTITMGIRWEYEAPVTERDGRLVNLDVAPDFSAAAPVIAAEGVGPITGHHYPRSLLTADRMGLQPRVGVAWRPLLTSSVVLRAGYGMYRNSGVYQALASQLAQQPPLSQTFNSTSTETTRLTLANGFIEPVATTLNTVAIDPDFRVGVVHRWQVSAQRDIPGALTVMATYLAGKGLHLPQSFLPNTYPAGVDHPCPACPSGFVYTTSHGTSMQQSVQFQVRRRLRAGLTWTTGYTLMKATDNASSFTGTGGQIAQNWLDLEAERGPSSFDQRHQFSVQTTYSTAQGTASTRTGLTGALLKGWTLTTNLTAGSGMPRTPTYRVTSIAGVTGTVRPDLTGAPIDEAPDGYYVNPAAFAPPAPGTWGNAGRNSIRGPSQFGLDASLTRQFPVYRRLSLDWQIDATNILNRVTYSTINTVVGSTQFGLPTATNGMRRINTNLRIRF